MGRGSEAATPGELQPLGVLPLKGAFGKKGAKQEDAAPNLGPCGPPPARPYPRPHPLVTKEKHAATLMQLRKCYFSSAARSSGLTPRPGRTACRRVGPTWSLAASAWDCR